MWYNRDMKGKLFLLIFAALFLFCAGQIFGKFKIEPAPADLSSVVTNAVEEVAEMAAAARALVLNLGTLQAWTLEAMLAAGKSAAAHGVPIVFDPVGADAQLHQIDES